MQRRLSSLVNKPGKPSPLGIYDDDTNDSASTLIKEEALVPPALKIKRVDYYYSRWYKNWRYKNTNSKVSLDTVPLLNSGPFANNDNDPWKDFSFVIVRTIPNSERPVIVNGNPTAEPTVKIVIKSPYLVKACKDVIRSWPGISWNADPLELEPEVFLTFLDEFHKYRDDLESRKPKTELETYVHQTVSLLLSTIENDFKQTISAIRKLKAHGEIKHEYLYAIFVPKSILVTQCAITGQPRLFQLRSYTRPFGKSYQLNCESWDLVDDPLTQTVKIGKVSMNIYITEFKGTVKIDSLDAFPLQFHPDAAALKKQVIERGKKWVSLIGIHHMQFDGVAAARRDKQLIRHKVKGRIMVDHASFKRYNTKHTHSIDVVENNITTIPSSNDPYSHSHQQNYNQYPPGTIPPGQPGAPATTTTTYANDTVVQTKANKNKKLSEAVELTSDDDLLLTSTVVSGFSLSDKLWLEFDITQVKDIAWDDEAFHSLVLPSNHKSLLKSLVEAHHQELGFDDFIRGKGQGLVINLFGPPGVGKTLSAEATSEHVKRPLYLVGAGDLGTTAKTLDSALERVFRIATTWKAIVLIDEADVFLEQRSLHDLERNAMVAVFLRHIEYYRGILFLTTNRVKAFDEAFLSRIHVALHFHDLPFESRVQVWQAFINRLDNGGQISLPEIKMLAERNVNGRQIKNAVRTAQSLASGRGEKLSFIHFIHTLDAMHDFTTEFESMNRAEGV